MRLTFPSLVLVGLAVLGTSCGKKGAPYPPEPGGPMPPREVEACQVGERAEIRFTVPNPRGARASQQPVLAELVRVDYSPGMTVPPDPNAFRLRGEVVDSKGADPFEAGARMRLEDRSLPGRIGWTLRYGVRMRDRRGRPSPLVLSADLVPIPPLLRPSGLKAEATADGIRLSWNPPQGEDALRYNVYRTLKDQPFGDKPLNAEPLVSSDTLDASVTMGNVYLYAVRTTVAEASPCRESEPSETAEVFSEDRFPPGAPSGLVGIQEGSAVRLFWNPNQERDISGYIVYRKLGEAPWERESKEATSEPSYLDRGIHVADHLSYRVTAVDRASPPNESAPSETIEVDAVEDPATGRSP